MSTSSTGPRPTSVPVAAAEPDVLSLREGRLFVDELSASELVDRFGSPIFVYSEVQLRRNLRRIREAFAQGWPSAQTPGDRSHRSKQRRVVISRLSPAPRLYTIQLGDP